jgi:hypothetical protein
MRSDVYVPVLHIPARPCVYGCVIEGLRIAGKLDLFGICASRRMHNIDSRCCRFQSGLVQVCLSLKPRVDSVNDPHSNQESQDYRDDQKPSSGSHTS